MKGLNPKENIRGHKPKIYEGPKLKGKIYEGINPRGKYMKGINPKKRYTRV